MKAIALIPLLGLALVPSAFGVGSATSVEDVSRIIDRTYRCNALLQGGIPKLRLSAQSAGAPLKRYLGPKVRAYGLLHSGGPSSSSGPGRPSVGGEALIFAVAGARPQATLAVTSTQCRSASADVPLSRARLEGFVAGPFEEVYECFPSRKVLVRVRAVFRRPTELRRSPGAQLVTAVPVRQVTMAVRTESGRPLALYEISESGRARLATASGTCVPD